MSDVTAELKKAQEHLENGQEAIAKKICADVLRQEPNNVEALHLQGYLSLLEGRPEEAVEILLMAIGQQADRPPIHFTLAIAYQSEGKIDEARASFHRVLKHDPDDVESLFNLANIYAEEGSFTQAMDYCKRALANDAGHAATRELQEVLSRTLQVKCIEMLDNYVPDDIGRGKPQVVYELRPTARLGHLVYEPFFLKCLFDPAEHDIIIVCPPKRVAVSEPVYNIAMQEVFPVEMENPDQSLNLWGQSWGTHEVSGRTYVIENTMTLGGKVLHKMKDGRFPYYYSLRDHDLEKGEELRKAMGIPLDAPIVTFYVREKGFFQELTYHNYRNSDVMNYIPSLKYLVDQGYFIVRLGDNKMQPLPDLGPQVIDTPFHPAYTQLVEPYFIAQSDFMLKTISGPDTLSTVFGTPCLLTNAHISPLLMYTQNDLCVFKKYYSHRHERNMSLREIASDKSVLFASRTQHFTEKHISLIENTADEILRATREMVVRKKGGYQEIPDVDSRFAALCKQIHEDCSSDLYGDTFKGLHATYFGPHLTGARLSHEFCSFYPEFLL